MKIAFFTSDCNYQVIGKYIMYVTKLAEHKRDAGMSFKTGKLVKFFKCVFGKMPEKSSMINKR